jgi:hypothetical protein
MAAAECLRLEDIAAMRDGKLTAEERERVAGHLGTCESCYETFAGVVHFLDDSREGGEEQRSLPSPLLPEEICAEESQPPASLPSAPRRPFEVRRKARSPRSRGWWAAAAAAALVVVTAGLLLLRWWGAAEMSTERLASLAGSPAAADLPWPGRVTRGEEERKELPPEKEAFRLGVYLLDLRVALASGSLDKINPTLGRLDNLLKDAEIGASETRPSVEAMWQKLRQGAPPRSFIPATAALEKKATEELALAPHLVELGSWTEACRLAGAGGRPDLFRERATRPLLDRVIAAGPQDEAALGTGDAVEVLRGIRQQIDAGRIDPAALGQRCENLLRVLDYD